MTTYRDANHAYRVACTLAKSGDRDAADQAMAKAHAMAKAVDKER